MQQYRKFKLIIMQRLLIHLQDFINEVNALREKKITGSEAEILIADAQAIISQLTGP